MKVLGYLTTPPTTRSAGNTRLDLAPIAQLKAQPATCSSSRSDVSPLAKPHVPVPDRQYRVAVDYICEICRYVMYYKLLHTGSSTKIAALSQPNLLTLPASSLVPSSHTPSAHQPTLCPFPGRCHTGRPTHSSSLPSSTAHGRGTNSARYGRYRPSRYCNQP